MDWLRKKGVSAAANKAGRVAAEGLVGICAERGFGTIVEINAETDFVARNQEFQTFVSKTCEIAQQFGGDIQLTQKAQFGDSKRTVAEELTHNIATIGENLTFRRCQSCSIGEGVVASYIHGAVKPGLGKIGVLVALESKGEQESLLLLGKQLAMHIAASQPRWLSIDDVDSSTIERERQILGEQARESGRPNDVIEKMVVGRLKKFYEEFVLLEQTFVMDNQTKVVKVLENAEKDLDAPIRISQFIRYNLGEGIEKEKSDFAAEVASTLQN